MKTRLSERVSLIVLLADLSAFSCAVAKLADLEKRLRCSKCGKKSCHIRAIEMQKPTPSAHQTLPAATCRV
jgi:hypothetical protein